MPPLWEDTQDAPLRFGEDNRDARAPLCPPLGHGGQVWRPFLPAVAGEKGAELWARVCVCELPHLCHVSKRHAVACSPRPLTMFRAAVVSRS